MNRFLILVLAGAIVVSAPMNVTAHHGAATLETSAEVTLKGIVKEWLWANPHCILKLEVKAPDGTVTTWSVATANVADSTKRGWARRSFSAGDEVTVVVSPAKSGAPVGMIKTAVLADGSKVQS